MFNVYQFILEIKVPKKYTLLISNIRKDQNEYVFTRYLSLIQWIIERTKSTNCINNNGSVNISWHTPISTKSDLITNVFKHNKQKYPTTHKVTKKNLLPINFSNTILFFIRKPLNSQLSPFLLPNVYTCYISILRSLRQPWTVRLLRQETVFWATNNVLRWG